MRFISKRLCEVNVLPRVHPPRRGRQRLGEYRLARLDKPGRRTPVPGRGDAQRSAAQPLRAGGPDDPPKLKVVYTTGGDVTDGMKALFVDGSAFLPKPYTPAQLVTAVGALLPN